MTHHRGIRLGVWSRSRPDEPRYRVRVGRSLALVTVAALSREWLDAYLGWYKVASEHGRAGELRQRWLAARKLRT